MVTVFATKRVPDEPSSRRLLLTVLGAELPPVVGDRAQTLDSLINRPPLAASQGERAMRPVPSVEPEPVGDSSADVRLHVAVERQAGGLDIGRRCRNGDGTS